MWSVDQSAVVTAAQKAAAARTSALAGYKAAFDAHLDAVAQSRQYDNRLTIAAYLGSTNPKWAAEAQAFVAWRDAALLYMFEQLAKVEGGEISPPSVDDFISSMPAIDWPQA